MSYNFLSDYEDMGSQLESFPQLEILNLAGNKFTGIPTMSSMGLQHINLSKNQIDSLPSGKFDNLERLEKLNLHGNNIEWIDGNAFSHLKSLTDLDLSQNRLVKFEGYFYLRSLQVLNLDMNKITDLGNFTMMGQGLSSLNHFRIGFIFAAKFATNNGASLKTQTWKI